MAYRTRFTPKKRAEFLKVLSRTGNVTHAARAVGMSRQGVYDAKYADEEFSKKWDDAVEQAIDLLEIEARRRAFKGTRKPVFFQGRQCGHIREYSDSLMMFLIKGKRPEYATERREVSGRDGGPVEVRNLSDGEIDSKLSQLLGKAGIDSAPGGTGEAEE